MPPRRRRAGEEGNKNETRYSIAKKSKKEAEEDVLKEILEEEALRNQNKELSSSSTAFPAAVSSDANSGIDEVHKVYVLYFNYYEMRPHYNALI